MTKLILVFSILCLSFLISFLGIFFYFFGANTHIFNFSKLSKIKNMNFEKVTFKSKSFDFNFQFIKNLLMINNIPISVSLFISLSFIIGITLSTIVFHFLKLLSISIVIFLFAFCLPTLLLNRLSIKRFKIIDVAVVQFIKLMKARSMASTNPNLIFKETITLLDENSPIYKIFNEISFRVSTSNVSLHDEIYNLGIILNNNNLISLSTVFYRAKEDGQSIKTLLRNQVLIIDNTVKSDLDNKNLSKRYIKDFFLLTSVYVIIIISLTFNFKGVFSYITTKGYSINITLSLIFLLLNGIFLFIFSHKGTRL